MAHKLTPDEGKALIKKSEERVKKAVEKGMESVKRFNEIQRLRKAKEKVRENRLRRVLARRGYTLEKTRRRDPHALDYGTYIITRVALPGEPHSGTAFHVAGYMPNTSIPCFDLDDVEKWLKADAKERFKERQREAMVKARNAANPFLPKMTPKEKKEHNRLLRKSCPDI